ncbi:MULTISPECIES: bestrophin family protein [unclassified Bacillus cereus group]|uniref:bestrophin family protein n=1 Tax=unclassified Bacillus cereus group TaxID=2750818 RepID=UPI0022E25D9C|nr:MULTISPECIES: bestrophin family ion channel [unclassified Bacillus cereus group]MDA1798442.1 bestrophin family ion channel [Bacillus cereus group sp. BY6-1LC]MDA1804441.1 bestrophin family ion channel [Bacillus cereus group sp. BY32LC]
MVHYNNQNSLHQIFTLKGTVIRDIFPQILLYICVSTVVTVIHYYYAEIHINQTPWVIVGGALGLLLVFRTNTAYDRYWEGRKLFGTIGACSRNLAVSFLCYWDSEGEKTDQEQLKFLHLLIAFPKIAKRHLRDEKDLSEIKELLNVCSEKEKEMLEQSMHLPISIVLMLKAILSKGLKMGQIHPNAIINMETDLNNMLTAVGGCDRIKTTPIPFAYFAHIKILLLIFCGTLPIGLVDSLGWVTVLATMFISFAFIGIEAIGVEIEDPFGQDPNDLPLEGICIGVETHLVNLYNQNKLLEVTDLNRDKKII